MTPLERAYRWISQRSHSEADLRRRLAAYAGPEEIDPLIQRLKQLKLLDDFDFSSRRASYRLSERHQGLRRIEADLESHGVAHATASRAIQETLQHTSEAEAAEKVLTAYLQKHAEPKSVAEWRRVLGYLGRKGFSEDAIRRAFDAHRLAMEDLSS
jgi:SOS response regulatory protein OraA/RecX